MVSNSTTGAKMGLKRGVVRVRSGGKAGTGWLKICCRYCLCIVSRWREIVKKMRAIVFCVEKY